MELVILIGLPASGKTSFFRARFEGTHAHVSKDLFRNARRPDRRQRTLVTEALAAGRSVVVDNTNPTRADRAALIGMAREAGARVVGYFFESKAADCRERNAGREGKARVPVVAIHAATKRLELPSRAEGFDELFFVRLVVGGGFEVSSWNEGGCVRDADATSGGVSRDAHSGRGVADSPP